MLYATSLYQVREKLSDPIAMKIEEGEGNPNVGHVLFLVDP